MNTAEHLLLAAANHELSEALLDSPEELHWRWCVVTSFYSAHHYLHALFARYGDWLPPQPRRLGNGQQVMVNLVHPGVHRHVVGGTPFSIERLSSHFPAQCSRLLDIFDAMLQDSQAARYGAMRGTRYSVISRETASLNLERLHELISIVEPLLEPAVS